LEGIEKYKILLYMINYICTNLSDQYIGVASAISNNQTTTTCFFQRLVLKKCAKILYFIFCLFLKMIL